MRYELDKKAELSDFGLGSEMFRGGLYRRGDLCYGRIWVSLPTQEEVVRILEKIRIWGRNTHKSGSDHDHLNKLVAWYSRRLTSADTAVDEMAESTGENGVAPSAPIIRACL